MTFITFSLDSFPSRARVYFVPSSSWSSILTLFRKSVNTSPCKVDLRCSGCELVNYATRIVGQRMRGLGGVTGVHYTIVRECLCNGFFSTIEARINSLLERN